MNKNELNAFILKLDNLLEDAQKASDTKTYNAVEAFIKKYESLVSQLYQDRSFQLQNEEFGLDVKKEDLYTFDGTPSNQAPVVLGKIITNLKGLKIHMHSGRKRGDSENYYRIKKSNFWAWSTIIIAIIGMIFALGFYFGQAKFDKEKIDWYSQNKELRKEVKTFIGENERLEKEIKYLKTKISNFEVEKKRIQDEFADYYTATKDKINHKSKKDDNKAQ